MSSENQNQPTTQGFFQNLIAPHASIQEIGARRQVQLLASLSLGYTVLLTIEILGFFIGQGITSSSTVALIPIIPSLGAYFLSRTRYFISGGWLLMAAIFASTFGLIIGGGDPSYALMLNTGIIFLVGSALFSLRAITVLVIGITLISPVVLHFLAPKLSASGIGQNVGFTISLGGVMLIVVAFRNSLERRRLQEIRDINRELQGIHIDLKGQVEERTSSLEQRNATLQAITEFARLTNQVQGENDLIQQSTHLLAEKFKIDHVGIFLVDDLGGSAVLRGTNSDEGRSLIADRYQLKVAHGELSYFLSETNILQYQIGGQSYRISQPASIPNMNSNISTPLLVGQRLMGILNLQTRSPIIELDKTTLETFADQIALSLQNIRLLDQLQSRLSEISLLAGQTVKRSWEQIRAGGSIGYFYDQIQIIPREENFPPEITTKLLGGESVSYVVTDENPRTRLIAPIVLRDEIIGIIGYENNDPQYDWSAEEKALLDTISSRVSLAIENTRLVAEAQQRAERERVISQIAGRMRESLDVDTVLKTAVQEMRQSLNLDQAEVRLLLPTQSGKSEAKKRSKRNNGSHE